MRTKIKINKIFLLGIVFLFIGVFAFVFKFYDDNKIMKYEEKNMELFFEEQNKENTSNVDYNDMSNKFEEKKSNYIAVIEIPKISLKRGLFDINNKNNNVDKNIEILKDSVFPCEEKGTLFLAGHAGNSRVSFFKDLNKLKEKDNIFFYYKNIKYIYEIKNIYEINKTGKLQLKNSNSSRIVLITCVSGTDKQLVFIGNLVEKQKY